MSKKCRKSVFFFLLLFSSAVVAEVRPENVVMFFMPLRNSGEITSVQEAVPTQIPFGVSKVSEDFPKNENAEKHGLNTSVGVSLYDKGKVPLEQATENILAPARVLILPPERRKKRKTAETVKSAESVIPDRVRIFPMKNPLADLRKAAKEHPVIVRHQRLMPPQIVREERPEDEAEWTNWILRQLDDCSMDARTVLPTLYWMAANKRLTDGKTDCDMKEAVAAHLRKCHPWPTVYYTPVNNDVPVRPAVQMAAEILENTFETKNCPALDLTRVNFEKTDFINGSLKNADFSKSYLKEATFSDFDLSDAVFNEAEMDNVLFRHSDLSGATFENARLKDSHLHHVNAVSTRFNRADLQNAQFRDVNLSQALFDDAVLQNTAWADVRAYRIQARRTDFTMSVFNNVLFNQMLAPKANFSRITCLECIFDNSDLDEAYFYKADFKEGVSLKNVSLYKAGFDDVDLTAFKDLPLEELLRMKFNRKTVLPEHLEDYNLTVLADEQKKGKPAAETKIDRYTCSNRTCEERLAGRDNNQNFAIRAMTVLGNPYESLDSHLWALCTMGCIIRKDKKLENSQSDILAAFVKQKRPWDSENDLFKPYTPIEPEVQMALYLLTDPEAQRDLGHDIDLTGTDLRTANLFGGDLRMINFSGSHLGGAELRRAKTDQTFARFNQVVIDQFTRFPAGMKKFVPFELPDSIVPPWWKPATVRVFRDGTHPWTVTTEDVPFSDDLIPEPLDRSGEMQ